jgi:hypothetical protein
MSRDDVMARLAEEEALTADGLDDAIIGFGYRCGQPVLAVYDRELAIKVFAAQFKASEPDMPEAEAWEQAEEYYEFNTAGAWVGEKTPVWVTRCAASNHAAAAEAIVADLFESAGGRGARLQIRDGNERDLGGWCRESVRTRVLAKLQELL